MLVLWKMGWLYIGEDEEEDDETMPSVLPPRGRGEKEPLTAKDGIGGNVEEDEESQSGSGDVEAPLTSTVPIKGGGGKATTLSKGKELGTTKTQDSIFDATDV